MIQDREQYLKEAHSILGDVKYYQILEKDLSVEYLRDYNHLVDNAFENKILNKKRKNSLKVQHPNMAFLPFTRDT